MTLNEPTTRLELLGAYVEKGNKRLPVSALGTIEPHPHEPGIHHLHGELCWTVGERRVPAMGVGDPDEVCLGMWWDELNAAIATMAAGGSYRYDPILQGVPAFFFERSGSTVFLSLVASATDAEPDPDWQRVPFAWSDFVEEVRSFQAQLRDLLRAEGPRALPEDWAARLTRSA